MKHCILVKWNEQVSDRQAIAAEVEGLYSGAAEITGVRGVRLLRNCVDRSNRYDLLIELDMEKEALSDWDASALHHRWKEQYGSLIAAKAIFDFEKE